MTSGQLHLRVLGSHFPRVKMDNVFDRIFCVVFLVIGSTKRCSIWTSRSGKKSYWVRKEQRNRLLHTKISGFLVAYGTDYAIIDTCYMGRLLLRQWSLSRTPWHQENKPCRKASGDFISNKMPSGQRSEIGESRTWWKRAMGKDLHQLLIVALVMKTGKGKVSKK